ncbi:MAG: outer-membrane lipoprotein carrier protein LolA [Pyrinomonadaceae bacterium]
MRIHDGMIGRLLILTIAVSFFGVVSASAQLNDILTTMDKHKKSLQTLKAKVRFSEYEATLADETERKGAVQYISKPGRDAWVRIDWASPDESLIVANGKYVLWRKDKGEAVVGNVEESKSQKATSNSLKFMSMSKAELKANYTTAYLGEATVDGTTTWHLKLTPKNADEFREAELWVDGNGMPIQAMIVQKNKDKATVRLSSLEKNVTIDAKIFSPDLKGVKKIRG